MDWPSGRKAVQAGRVSTFCKQLHTAGSVGLVEAMIRYVDEGQEEGSGPKTTKRCSAPRSTCHANDSGAARHACA